MAKTELKRFAATDTTAFLSTFHIAGDGCWFFFANEEIPTKTGGRRGLVFTAYAVAQTGIQALVYDFRPNMMQMMDYVGVWSLYGRGKKAEAIAALEVFSKQYQVGIEQ